MTSYFSRSNNTSRSSILVNEIGYDAERATWTKDTYAATNPFRPGDMLVIETRPKMSQKSPQIIIHNPFIGIFGLYLCIITQLGKITAN